MVNSNYYFITQIYCKVGRVDSYDNLLEAITQTVRTTSLVEVLPRLESVLSRIALTGLEQRNYRLFQPYSRV